MNHLLHGLVAATFTPLNDRGDLNLEHVPPMVDFLIDQGVRGAYVCGSTGEGPSLTTDERKAVAEAYITAAAGRMPVVIQVGHNSLRDAQDLAAHAQRAGADGISAVAPSYFKPTTMASLVGCVKEVAEAAPQLPFYYYHIPGLSGINFRMSAFLEEAAAVVPNFAGIKFSDVAIDDLQRCVEVSDGRFNVLYGSDERLLSGMVVGCQGAVGSTYNYAAPIYNRVLAALEAGDMVEARRNQSLAVQMVEVILRWGGLPAIKELMKLLGHDCGPCRLPLNTLTDADVAAMKKDLDACRFFEALAE